MYKKFKLKGYYLKYKKLYILNNFLYPLYTQKKHFTICIIKNILFFIFAKVGLL